MNTIAQIGGIFSLLVFLHFIADFIFQSHTEAMSKHIFKLVRAMHCFIYSTIMCIVISIFYPSYTIIIFWVILFLSHYLEDSYIPVFVWAKYIRKPEEPFGKEQFIKFINTTLGKILMIVVDQLVHIAFLLPISAIIVLDIKYMMYIVEATGVLLAFLWVTCIIGKELYKGNHE